MQLLVSVEDPPALIVGGDALSVQYCTDTVAEDGLPAPAPLLPVSV